MFLQVKTQEICKGANTYLVAWHKLCISTNGELNSSQQCKPQHL